MIKDFAFSIICNDDTFKICLLLFWTHDSFYNIQSEDYSKQYLIRRLYQIASYIKITFLFIDYDLNIFWWRQLQEILTSLAPCQLK